MSRSPRARLALAIALLILLAWQLVGIGSGSDAPLPTPPAVPAASALPTVGVASAALETTPRPISAAVWPRARVIDANSGAGIAGAALACRERDAPCGPWLTGPTGEASLVDWSGPRELTARAEGYFPVDLAMDAPPAEAPPAPPTVALHPQGRLEVRAVNDAGSPVADVHFQVRPRDELSAVADLLPWPVSPPRTRKGAPPSSRTSGDAAVIDPLPCGVPLTVQWRQGGLTGSSEVTIHPSDRRAQLEVVIAGLSEVVGRLVDEAGTPLGGRSIEILVSPRIGATEPICRTNPDGTFEVVGVPTGPAVLVVTDTPDRYAIDVVAPLTDVGDLVARQPVRVSGTIVDGSLPPQPAWSYLVEALSPGHHLVSRVSGKDGTFSLLVPAGPVSLRVRAGRTGWWDDPGILGELQTTAPAEDLRIDLHETSGQIRGRLPPDVDRERVQVVLFRYQKSGERGVSLIFNSGSYDDVQVDGGSFVLGPLTPDRYDVLVRCGADGNARVVDTRVAAGSVTDLGLLTVGRARLVCSEPSATEHPGVVARPLDPNGEPRSAEASEDLALDAGPWLLFPAEAAAGRTHGRLLDAFPGQRITWSAGDWDDTSSITGRAQQAEAPVVGAEVRLMPGVGTDALGASGLLATRRTDEQGRFSFEHVLPGEYRLVVSPGRSAGPTTRTVTVTGGEPLDVVLDLAGAVAQLRLLSGAEPLVGVTALDLHGIADGDLHTWRRYQQGEWLEVPCVGAPAWLCVTLSPNALDERTHGVGHAVGVDALAPGSQVVLQLPDNTLLVDVAPDAAGVPEPFVLLPHGGGAVTEVQWRARHAGGGLLRHGGLPAGATLRLTGRDKHGRFIEREVVVPVGQRTISWP